MTFQSTSPRQLRLNSTTSLTSFRKQIRFALFPFRSLLIRESLLISFPTGTKMFQFPACVSLSGFSKNTFSHSEILGSKPACGSPRLIAACHVLHHNPNQAIHLTAYKIRSKTDLVFSFRFLIVETIAFLLASLNINSA